MVARGHHLCRGPRARAEAELFLRRLDLRQMSLWARRGPNKLVVRQVRQTRAGARPMALGAVLWVLVAVSSLGLQALTGTL